MRDWSFDLDCIGFFNNWSEIVMFFKGDKKSCYLGLEKLDLGDCDWR